MTHSMTKIIHMISNSYPVIQWGRAMIPIRCGGRPLRKLVTWSRDSVLGGPGHAFLLPLPCYHRIEINLQKSNSMSAHLKFMSSRMSLCASHRRHPTPSVRRPSGKFPRQFWPPAVFVYKYKTLAKRHAFVTGKCRLNRHNFPFRKRSLPPIH